MNIKSRRYSYPYFPFAASQHSLLFLFPLWCFCVFRFFACWLCAKPLNMFGLSNSLIGILNFLTFLLSIPILWIGVWLSKQGVTECERWLEKPIIVLGVFLLLVSLAGLVGACCRNSLLLWIYLVVMFLLIVLVAAFTVFAFVVTNKGAGEVLSGRGYKEYRLGDYSNWLQKRVNNTKDWNRIKSCLQSGKLCSKFQSQFVNDNAQKLYTENLSALQVLWTFVLEISCLLAFDLWIFFFVFGFSLHLFKQDSSLISGICPDHNRGYLKFV